MLMLFFVHGCDDPNDPQRVVDTYLGQSPPGAAPIRFAEGIIGDNFYPHSKLIVSPGTDRIW